MNVNVTFSETDEALNTKASNGTAAFAANMGSVVVVGDGGGNGAASLVKSVKEYGALGDGSTNDTAAFQSALAAERVVYVPGGTYVLSGTLVIRENCCLELSQDTVLKFTNTSGNCIEMRGSAVLRGNHAVISAAYGLTGNVIDMDTLDDGTDPKTVPPYEKEDPQYKRQRFVYDVNIIKPNSIGKNRTADGNCNGTAIYMHGDGSNAINFLWVVSMSGIRIAGGFSYGIRAMNTGKGWNHDMRIEAAIEGCKVGVALENCNGAYLDVVVQPVLASDGTVYAEHGFYLNNSKYVDMMRSRVWDWQNDGLTLWENGGQYQHIALIGNCRGLLLGDYNCTEAVAYPIRDLIYTDTPSNFDTMTILQEPGNKNFKSIDNVPYFNNGTTNRKLMLATDKFTTEQMEFISPADGYYTYEDNFTNLVTGYEDGKYLTGSSTSAKDGYTTTDFIPIDGGASHTYRIGGEGIKFTGVDPWGYNLECRIAWYDASKNLKGSVMPQYSIGSSKYYPQWVEDETVAAAFVTNADVAAPKGAAFFRVTAYGEGKNLRVTIDEKQDYIATWHGEPKRLDDSIKVKAENVVGLEGGTGATGRRGTGLLPVTTAPSAYTTAVNGLTPAYRIALSTVKSQASTDEVFAGDTVRHSYYHYPVIYVDSSYVYCGTRVSIRGATGAAGAAGAAGADGRGIQSITTEHDDSGNFTMVQIAYTDGTVAGFTIPDGEDGTNGTNGRSIIYCDIAAAGTAVTNVSHFNTKPATGDLVLCSDGSICEVKSAVGTLYTLGEALTNISSGSSGGGVSSWNDLTDKPFGEEITEILPETTVEIDPDMGMGIIPVDFTVVGGKDYTVKFNGVDYVTSCIEPVEGVFALGNLGAFGEDFPITEHPFVIASEYMDDGTIAWAVGALDGSASVTLSIVETITKIEKKYIPSTSYVLDVDATKTTTPSITMDTTDLVNAIFNDAPIFANCRYVRNNNTWMSRMCAHPKMAGDTGHTSLKEYITALIAAGMSKDSIPIRLDCYDGEADIKVNINTTQ